MLSTLNWTLVMMPDQSMPSLIAARLFGAFGLLCEIPVAWLAAAQGLGFAAGLGALTSFGAALFALLLGSA